LLDERSPKLSWLPTELRWLSKQIRPLLYLHIGSFLCITAGSLLGLLTPLVMKWLIDQIIPQRQVGLLVLSVLVIFLCNQSRTALTGLGNYLTLSAAQTTALTLRMCLLRHLGALSADYYEDTPLGTIMYPLREPTDEISYFGSDLLPALLRATLTTCFTVITMVALSPGLTLVILPLVPFFIIVRQYFRRRLIVESEIVQIDRLAWNEFLEEHLSSAISIQLLGQQKRRERKAFQCLGHTVRSQLGLFRSGVWFTVGSSLAVVLSTCAVIGFGGVRVLAGAMSVGTLVAFYTFAAQLFEPLGGVAELYARTQKTFASIRQIQSTLALKPSVSNAAVIDRRSQIYQSHIDFVDVEFGYRRRKTTLRVTSLRLSAGERIAIVGENGAGKSTLVKLIARIYDVDAGAICIGGIDIRSLKLENLRRFVCYLPRDPTLFNGTLVSNLRYVNPAASDRDLEEAIRCTGLSAFVATLAEGWHQRIGPGACQLSGGQRQRLAIARALLQKPQILILDEATSCLDSSSEGQLLRGVQQSLSDSTLIVVSHRLSTLSTVARVITLRGGRVIRDKNSDSFQTVEGVSYS
jgi:ABC-type bacteriocin/lantibiotic exporter with double-glycine peptidase domain